MEKGGTRVGVSPQGGHGTKRVHEKRERERSRAGREGRKEMQEGTKGS